MMFEPEYGCPKCGDKLVKYYNTNEKTVITLEGKLVCWERVLKCRNKNCAGNSMSFHSAEFKGLTLPGMSFGIDVVAREGELRFEEHKTIDEIVENLKEGGVHLTGAAVSKHLDKYLALISGYQKEKIEEICKALAKQGGYVLQIDGTVSVKTKTLYIFRDNISGTILYAALARDDKDNVKPLVQYVNDSFGKPLAVVSDMQNAIIESVSEVFPGVPHQFCQYHFLKNVGNAILLEKHQQLGTMIRKKEVKKEIQKIQDEVEVKKKDDKLFQIIYIFCCLLLGVTTMQAPFGLYYVELFKRYWHVRTAIRKCINLCDADSEHHKILIELDMFLSSVVSDKAIKELVRKIEYYNHFFIRLCDIFKDVSGRGKAVMDQVEKRMKRYLTEMKNRSKNDPELKKITSRLEKYWSGLFFTYEFEYIPSTNNDLESFIKDFKKIWKRITGFYNVNRWISFHGPFAVYLFNFHKRGDGKSPFEFLGFDNLDFASMVGKVSADMYENERIKQMNLRETYRIRLEVNQKGDKKYLDALVKDFENEVNIKRS